MSTSNGLNEGCVAFNLRRASRIVTRRYEDALKPVDLTSFQFTALVALSDYPAIPLFAMADGFGMGNSTVTRNLKPMQVRGLVQISKTAKDGRIKLASITPAGKRLLKKAMPLWKKAQAETLKELSAPQWGKLKQAIQNLA